jgi:uncharacterized membrane protein YedE/YeeE
MPFAGGCASGTCWRSAEGNVKQITAFVWMGISNSLATVYIRSSEAVNSFMGKEVFLPEYLSYNWSLMLIVLLMVFYYGVTSWNEKTRAFI